MRIVSIVFLCLSLLACKEQDTDSLKIGTLAGPESEILARAKIIAQEKYGLKIKIIEFSDYNLPNAALADGSLDANIYQHGPYLKAAMKAQGYDFEVLAKTFVYPAALYSKKHKDLKTLPTKAVIAIPNDPSNELRALLLLEKAGLIVLKSKKSATLADILKNPKQLRIKELDAAQLPRILTEVDAAVINTNFAIAAGLSLSNDALFKEDKDAPYANLIVIQSNTLKRKQLDDFAKAFQSPEVKERAQEIFGDAALAAW